MKFLEEFDKALQADTVASRIQRAYQEGFEHGMQALIDHLAVCPGVADKTLLPALVLKRPVVQS